MAIPKTKAELLSLADPDSEYLEASKNAPGLPPLPEDFASMARLLRQLSDKSPYPTDPSVQEHEMTIPARDGYALRTVVFEPAGRSPETELPLVVLYHGGGYCIGKPESIRRQANLFLRSVPAVVVAPSYRLAPEHPFPAAINDAWDALQWCASNASDPSISANPSLGFVVGGISAGAGLANVLCHLAKDNAMPLTGAYISCTQNCPPEHVPERFKSRYLSRTQEEVKNDTILRPIFIKAFMENYKPDMNSPMYSSFLWPSGHTGLPATYIQICGMEFSRDEAIIYSDVLQNEAGVQTRTDLYKGLPHCFWGVYKDISAAKRWEQDTVDGFKWLLTTPRESPQFSEGSKFRIRWDKHALDWTDYAHEVEVRWPKRELHNTWAAELLCTCAGM